MKLFEENIKLQEQNQQLMVLLQIDDTLYINWSDWQGTSKSEGEGIKDVGAAVSLICSSTQLMKLDEQNQQLIQMLQNILQKEN